MDVVLLWLTVLLQFQGSKNWSQGPDIVVLLVTITMKTLAE